MSAILESFPEAVPVCSEVTGRQLSGFGITEKVVIKKPGDKLITADYEFEFISYSSEMHLWEGLLLFDTKSGLFFSSDLMFRLGNAEGAVIDGTWQVEVENITPLQVPDQDRRLQLKETLKKLHPNFIATGHGPCIKL